MKIKNIKFAVAAAAALIIFTTSAWAQTLRTGEIVYSRKGMLGGCSDAAIWVVGLDGSNDRRITQGLHPRISPDGRKLLFKRFDPNVACSPFFNGAPEWWIRDLTTGIETKIFQNFRQSFGHYFSPDTNRASRQIIHDDTGTICQMSIDGTNQICFTAITPPIRQARHLGVRGDGLVVLHNGDTGDLPVSGLYTLNYDTSNRVKIPNTDINDQNPAWSNDGQTIAYSTASQRGASYPYYFDNLFTILPDGSNKTQLTFLNNLPFNEGFGHSLVWTLDNSTILASARIGGIAGIYKIAADGSGTIFGRIPILPGADPEWVGGIVPVRGEQQIASWSGGTASGGDYSLVNTVGQGFAGQSSVGGTYSLQSGFWAFDSLINKAPFDFDGDGKSDLSVFRPSNGTWYVNRSLEGFTLQQWGVATDKPVPADYDGDGKTDVAVWRADTGTWYVIKSRDNTILARQWGGAGDVPVPADYDADGKSDLAVWRAATGTWLVLQSGNNNAVAAQQWGANGDKPVIGDYDADGKADYAIWRPASGTWFVLRSSDGGVTAQQWGATDDKLVQADYDGDRRTDLAVWRPSTGTWYILRSTAGYLGQQWGDAADAPVPADYDGDGRADLVAWRPSNGTWYLLRSTQGYLGAQFGASGDVPAPAAFVP